MIAADNVADYCAELPSGTSIADVITRFAPRFERGSTECAPSIRNGRGGISPLNAWGFLCEEFDRTGEVPGCSIFMDKHLEGRPGRRLATDSFTPISGHSFDVGRRSPARRYA